MKILLTGASSYAGARLFFDLSESFDVTGTFSSNRLSEKFVHLDATDKQEVHAVVKKLQPGLIVHAANNASAKWCEANPQEAVKVNQMSTQYLVDAANAVGTKVMYVSSFSAKDTSNVYGKTKHEGEEITKKANAGYLILRSSLVLGMSPNTVNDRPFNRILKNLDEKNPAIYDTSWKFQPTYVRHISEVIQKSIEKNIWGETIAIATAELASRYDIARDILTPLGVAVTPKDAHDASPVITDDLSAIAKLNLPRYIYSDMMKFIIDEIKNRRTFVLA